MCAPGFLCSFGGVLQSFLRLSSVDTSDSILFALASAGDLRFDPAGRCLPRGQYQAGPQNPNEPHCPPFGGQQEACEESEQIWAVHGNAGWIEGSHRAHSARKVGQASMQ